MEWWNDLWLNEGFASFMENVGVNHIYPDWKMMDQVILNNNQGAMSADQLTNSHPIMAEVKDPAQINSLFDSISYDKVSESKLSFYALSLLCKINDFIIEKVSDSFLIIRCFRISTLLPGSLHSLPSSFAPVYLQGMSFNPVGLWDSFNCVNNCTNCNRCHVIAFKSSFVFHVSVSLSEIPVN